MAGTAPQIEWYLARGGQQYGPLSELEMQKFIELGHLRPSDLVWRQGFADWRPGSAVFPDLGKPKPASPAHAKAARAGAPKRTGQQGAAGRTQPGSRTGTSLAAQLQGVAPDQPPAPRRRRRGRVALLLLVLVLVPAAGWFAWQNREKVPDLEIAWTSALRYFADDTAGLYRVSPFAAAGDTAESIDTALQKTALWRLLKKEFPGWYAERVTEVEKQRSEKQDEAAIEKKLAEAVVTLRRRYAPQALSSSPKYLLQIAASFHENLLEMSKVGSEPCFGFISSGETNAQVLEMIKDPAKSEHLHRQVTAIFEAVANGRKTPQTHPPARKADYDVLVEQLKSRGWGQSELQTFSDQRALAKAPHDLVCKMVQDWIGAHLNVKDSDMQTRLLTETLKPLVHG